MPSPYIAGNSSADMHDPHQVWRSHSYDANGRDPTNWTDRSSGTLATAKLQHRVSAPLLQQFSFSSSFADGSNGNGVRPSLASTLSMGDDGNALLTATNVRFIGVTKRDAHCVYMVHVDTGLEQFVIHKRYSQFRDFRLRIFTTLQQAQHCGHGPCKQLQQLTQVKFPRRKLQLWKKGTDLIVARERLLLLQRFVEAMLRVYRMAPKRQLRCCVNANCPAMEEIRRFLQISSPMEHLLAMSTGSVASAQSCDAELKKERSSSFEECSTSELNNNSSRRPSRGLPPPTRASLQSESTAHQFEQLYPITEDTELVHMHA